MEEIITRKISKSEARKLYSKLIKIDIDVLERNKSNDAKKHNILKILNNVRAIFTGAYLHYKEVPEETMFERSIEERSKLRRGRIDEIKRKESSINGKLFRHYFKYLSPSNMYNQLSETKGKVNEIRVDLIKKTLTERKKSIEKVAKNYDFRIKENEKIIDIVERIFEYNQLNELGQDLKVLIPSQMLSRLPISLTQLKAGNNSEKLKSEIRQLLHSSYRAKKLTKYICKSLADII